MADFITPTSELEAVNVMLDVLGEDPVNSLLDIEATEASIALSTLRSVARSTLARGWTINEETITLPFNVDGYIIIPATFLSVIPTGADEGRNLVRRGERLYDLENNTYVFTAGVCLKTIVNLPFDELGEEFRQYIAIKAARTYQQRQLGSATLDGFTTTDVVTEWANLRAIENRRKNAMKRRSTLGVPYAY